MKKNITANRTGWILTLLIASFATIQNTHADPIVYGDIQADRITYKSITENSTTDPFSPGSATEIVTGLYGVPEPLGDALVFNVPTFAAIAMDGPDVDITDGFLTFELAADSGMLMKRLFIEEFGAVKLQSNLGGTDLTNAGVVSPVFLHIREIVYDDGTVNGITETLDDPVTITGLSLQLDTPPVSGHVYGFESDSNIISWISDVDIDLVAELVAARPDINDTLPVRGITSLQFNMNNTMTASSEDVFATAFIDKKQVTINPELVANVPEPVLSLLMLVPMVWGLRRRM